MNTDQAHINTVLLMLLMVCTVGAMLALSNDQSLSRDGANSHLVTLAEVLQDRSMVPPQ